jgi:hypothetical protein
MKLFLELVSMKTNSPFSQDFSPHIPDFFPFSLDFSPRVFQLSSSVLYCSVVCSQLRILKIMIIGDRTSSKAEIRAESHEITPEKWKKNVAFRQEFSPKKMVKNVVFQTRFSP